MKPIVYIVVEEGNDSIVKIGMSTVGIKRLRGLRTGNPRPLRFHSTREFLTAPEAYAAEQYLHDCLKDHRVSGEWYGVHPAYAQMLLHRLRFEHLPKEPFL